MDNYLRRNTDSIMTISEYERRIARLQGALESIANGRLSELGARDMALQAIDNDRYVVMDIRSKAGED